MSLKNNYERFFGKMSEKPISDVKVITEQQKQKFSNLSNLCAQKYPHAPLTLKEGYVWMGSKKVEPLEQFLSRSSLQIQEMVRSFSNSNSKRLL